MSKAYTKKYLCMAKKRAKQKFIDSKGSASIKVLARAGKIEQTYVREWIREEAWADLVREEPGDLVDLSPDTVAYFESGQDSEGLNEQERLFCYHYLKTFNATTAAARAGYAVTYCYQKGHKLMQDPRIKNYLTKLKEKRDSELFIDSMDIMKQYIRIAFADITDIVVFKDYGLKLRPSDGVDGSVISEISLNEGGFKVKLQDKIRALQWLSDRMDMLPDVTAQRLEIEKEKLKILQENAKGTDDKPIEIVIKRKNKRSEVEDAGEGS